MTDGFWIFLGLAVAGYLIATGLTDIAAAIDTLAEAVEDED